MKLEFKVRDRISSLSIKEENGGYEIVLNDKTFKARLRSVSDKCLFLSIDGRPFRVYITEENSQKYIWVNGDQFLIGEVKTASRKLKKEEDDPAGKRAIITPMPGRIVRFAVQKDQLVDKNQPLVVMESMKMENEIVSPRKGRITKINFQAGDTLNFGDTIMEIE